MCFTFYSHVTGSKAGGRLSRDSRIPQYVLGGYQVPNTELSSEDTAVKATRVLLAWAFMLIGKIHELINHTKACIIQTGRKKSNLGLTENIGGKKSGKAFLRSWHLS